MAAVNEMRLPDFSVCLQAQVGIMPLKGKCIPRVQRVVLIFINITLSNRIVKPNNRYTRQPASHDFLFYSVPDKVYVLTATNCIAMRFAVRSATPLSYHADSSTVPKAEFEVAHCQRRNLKRHIATRRFAIARNAPTIPKAEFGAAHCRPPLRSCFPASSQAL